MELSQLRREDVPEDVAIRLGHRDEGHVVQEWEGYIALDENGQLDVSIEMELWPKFWQMSLGARQYLDLLHRSALERERRVGDIKVVEFDMSDDTCIQMKYRVRVPQAETLLACVEQAQAVQKEIERPVNDIANELDRTLARTSHSLAQGEFDPLEVLLARVDSATTPQEKGSALEQLVAAAVQQVPNFTILERNCNTETEEIDISVLNESSDPLFSREGPLALVECKNWGRNTPRAEISSFEGKIRNRRQRCTLSYFVSWADLSRKAHLELLRFSREDFVIVPINGSSLRGAVVAGHTAVADLFRSSFTDALHD